MTNRVENRPWVEKYRPKVLDDIVNQKGIIKRLKQFVKDNSMPHLIFAGPALKAICKR